MRFLALKKTQINGETGDEYERFMSYGPRRMIKKNWYVYTIST